MFVCCPVGSFVFGFVVFWCFGSGVLCVLSFCVLCVSHPSIITVYFVCV